MCVGFGYGTRHRYKVLIHVLWSYTCVSFESWDTGIFNLNNSQLVSKVLEHNSYAC